MYKKKKRTAEVSSTRESESSLLAPLSLRSRSLSLSPSRYSLMFVAYVPFCVCDYIVVCAIKFVEEHSGTSKEE